MVNVYPSFQVVLRDQRNVAKALKKEPADIGDFIQLSSTRHTPGGQETVVGFTIGNDPFYRIMCTSTKHLIKDNYCKTSNMYYL